MTTWRFLLMWRATPPAALSLAALRAILGERLGLPVLLGYGPRYLHSIGQLYKGGPASGMFLMITAEKSGTCRFPARSIRLASLQMAQALGDLQSLGRLGKPALRLHLTEGVPRVWPPCNERSKMYSPPLVRQFEGRLMPGN